MAKMEKESLVGVVRGHCPPGELPSSRSRTVRVYLSSTPDMSPERSAIQRVVYPKLKQYCAGKYGIDFQLVEFHWGVEESTGYLSSDLDIIRDEITACKERSIGPAFLCLVGHKLGPTFLPREIKPEHYELIAERMDGQSPGAGSQLDKYYTLDTQTTHGEEGDDLVPVYSLQRDHISTFNSESAKSREGRSDVAQFKRDFRLSVFAAAAEGLFTEDVKKNYTPTAFETEVEVGLKDTPEKLKGTAVCVVRIVRDLDGYHDDPQHGRFCDVTDGAPDEESQNRLLHIREIEVQQSLPGSNLKKITSDWESVAVAVDRRSEEFKVAKFAQKLKQGATMRLMKHEDYLQDICNKVQSQLKQLVDRAAAPLAMEKHSTVDKVYAEVIQHWRRVDELAQEEVEEDQETVIRLLKYLSDDMPFICIVHGHNAAARSRILSKAASSAITPVRTTTIKPYTILRLLPTLPPHDQTLRHLLWSLCRQIHYLYNSPWTETTNTEQLMKDFEQALRQIPTPTNPLHIHIDGLELLGLTQEQLELPWIPQNLPDHVKLIVSCGSSDKALLQSLSNKTPYEALIIDLDGDASCSDDDDNEENEGMFERVGDNGGGGECRGNQSIQASKIQHKQSAARERDISDPLDNSCSNEQLNNRTPNDHADNRTCGKGSQQLLGVMTRALQTAGVQITESAVFDEVVTVWLRHLERRHGRLLVAAVFRLLCLSNKGLTECELLDLLSLDDELLNEGVFLGVQPLLRRFPDLLLARLKHDLSPILQVSDIDKRDVLSFTSAEIEELTRNTFISTVTPASKTHHQIAVYFMSIAAKPKPMDDCHSIASSYGGCVVEPEIRVDPQPSIYENPDAIYSAVNYNMRRLSELPHHLLHGGQIDELLKHVIFNYKWLHNKLSATSPTELISVLSGLAQSDPLKDSGDVSKLVKVLEDSFLFIQESPECLRSEITGRLLNLLGTSSLISSLIRQCDDEGYKHCPITALNTIFDDRQDAVEQIIPCDTGYYEELYMASVAGKKEVITYTVPEKLVLWDTESVKKEMNFECNQYTYCTDIRVSQNGINVLALNNGFPKQSFLEDAPMLDIFDIDTGKKLHRIYFKESRNKPKRLFRVLGLNERRIMFDTPTYAAVCVDVVRLCSVKSGREITKLPWPFLVTPDERFLVMTEKDGQKLVLRSLPELEVIGKLVSPKNITAIVAIVSETSLSILVAAGSAGTLSRYNLDEVNPDSGPLEPVKQGMLIEKKDSSMKGGCGSLVISKDNIYALAVYIYASGRDLHRTNFVVSTESLENVHIYESGVKDQAQFSPDGAYLVHLKVKNGVFDIIEIASGNVITSYQTQGQIRQICPIVGSDENAIFVVTKKELQMIDLDKLIESGKREQEEVDSDSDAASVEYNTPRIRLRTLSADVPLSALMTSKSVESIPVKLTQINEASGEVKSANINLLRGIHFAESELASYLSEARVTPNGRKFLLTFEQLHIVGNSKKGDRKVLSGPLNDDFSHTKVTASMAGMSRDIFGVGTNALSQGTPLQKGSKIYGNNDTRRGTIFEAEGGETIQRCPSVIRVYDAETGDCRQAIQVRNEKLLACTDSHIVTASGDGEFTNVYSITSGQLAATLDCPPSSAVFTVDDNCLVIVPQKNSCVLHIHTGANYLDLQKCDLSDGDLSIWEVMTCSRAPTAVLVSLLGERPGQKDACSINYVWVDVTSAVITHSFSCHSELVQMSPDGKIGVDSEFRFYDIRDGKTLFQIQLEDITLSEHASFITDDATLMVFLDNENGKINVIDIQKKKLVSKSFFHPARSKIDSLRGHHDVASLIPLHGGLQMVVIDGNSVKHFLLQTQKRQLIAMGMVKLRKHGFDSLEARTQYYHSVNGDGDVKLTRRTSHKVLHRVFGNRKLHVYGKRK